MYDIFNRQITFLVYEYVKLYKLYLWIFKAETQHEQMEKKNTRRKEIKQESYHTSEHIPQLALLYYKKKIQININLYLEAIRWGFRAVYMWSSIRTHLVKQHNKPGRGDISNIMHSLQISRTYFVLKWIWAN